MVSVLDRQSKDSGLKSRPGQKFGLEFLWKDETALEKTGLGQPALICRG